MMSLESVLLRQSLIKASAGAVHKNICPRVFQSSKKNNHEKAVLGRIASFFWVIVAHYQKSGTFLPQYSLSQRLINHQKLYGGY